MENGEAAPVRPCPHIDLKVDKDSALAKCVDCNEVFDGDAYVRVLESSYLAQAAERHKAEVEVDRLKDLMVNLSEKLINQKYVAPVGARGWVPTLVILLVILNIGFWHWLEHEDHEEDLEASERRLLEVIKDNNRMKAKATVSPPQ